MPVYDYECASCGTFEAARRIAERDEPAACPLCGANAQASGAEDAGSYGMRHRGGCLCCG